MASIRPAQESDAPGIARVNVESWRSTYAGLLPADFLANFSVERREVFWRERITSRTGGEFVYVAETPEGEVIGYATGGPERDGHPLYTGELYAIYLLAAAQRQGVGRALTQAVAHRLLEKGYLAMLVWVLAANPSRGFYEALGGVYVSEKPITIGSTTLTEVAYGWGDLHTLIPRETSGS